VLHKRDLDTLLKQPPTKKLKPDYETNKIVLWMQTLMENTSVRQMKTITPELNNSNLSQISEIASATLFQGTRFCFEWEIIQHYLTMALLKSHAVYDAGGNGNCGPLCLAAFLKILQYSKNLSPGLTSCENHETMRKRIAESRGVQPKPSQNWTDLEWKEVTNVYQINIVLFVFGFDVID
jgi:hypothetical protein